MSSPPIQWYPGHIAKAEQQLKRNLDKVDLVIEVRDARIPLATGHPHLNRWINGKQHLLVINRRDMVTSEARVAWEAWFKARGQRTVWCDAKAGTGVKQVQQAAIRAGDQLNERRRNRGMRPRPVRALTLGFPNVGKSALINRLVKQKVVASARRAGVTRTLRWVRLGQDLDLLDAPGVLPPRLDKAFTRGLAKAAQATNAWVFTCGERSNLGALTAGHALAFGAKNTPKKQEFGYGLPGAANVLGEFDPAGFMEGKDKLEVYRLREAELAHGRVGMLASAGFLVQEKFHPLFVPTLSLCSENSA